MHLCRCPFVLAINVCGGPRKKGMKKSRITTDAPEQREDCLGVPPYLHKYKLQWYTRNRHLSVFA